MNVFLNTTSVQKGELIMLEMLPNTKREYTGSAPYVIFGSPKWF